MPPTVKALEIDQFDRAIFAIDLNGSEDFDAARFKEQAKAVALTSKKRTSESDLKFVVLGSQMVLFSYDRMHVDAYMDLPFDKYSGELACAGMVEIGEQGCSIWGDSSSLEKYREFKRETSNEFKQTVLTAALGEHFSVS